MEFPAGFLPTNLLILSHILFWPFFIEALIKARWQHLKNFHDSNVLFGAVAITAVFWSMDASIRTGINFHLTLIPLLSLMFGRHFTLFACILILGLLSLFNNASLQGIPINVFLFAVIPGLVISALLVFARRYLPHNFFIYIFINAFFGAAISVFLSVMATYGLFRFFDVYTDEVLMHDYMPFGLMMMFPEAFITGALISLFVVYKPQWVSSFNDELYLKGK